MTYNTVNSPCVHWTLQGFPPHSKRPRPHHRLHVQDLTRVHTHSAPALLTSMWPKGLCTYTSPWQNSPLRYCMVHSSFPSLRTQMQPSLTIPYKTAACPQPFSLSLLLPVSFSLQHLWHILDLLTYLLMVCLSPFEPKSHKAFFVCFVRCCTFSTSPTAGLRGTGHTFAAWLRGLWKWLKKCGRLG